MSENNCCDTNTTTSCCGGEGPLCDQKEHCKEHYIVGEIPTVRGNIPVVSTSLVAKDKAGMLKVRFGIGRMDYKVKPGLYAVGIPNSESPVLVSANYKLTFDTLRKELLGLDCWILVLDTKGVNVWCAAGKGTFGTDELVRRIQASGLAAIASNRQIILPQLGAPGISAHEVKKQTGFSVVYGPVRAEDIKSFVASGNQATDNMREVKFTMRDRLVLAPMELVPAAKISLIVFGVMFLFNLFLARSFGLGDVIVYVAAMITGTVLTPMLLPFVPGKAFAWKGWLLGFVVTACLLWLNGWFTLPNILLAVGYLLALPSYSAFLAMNFTGSSTYTSFSGVIKEMKVAVPLIIITLVAGAILVLVKGFIG